MPETLKHFDFIRQQLPPWLRSTSLQRFAALKKQRPDFTELYRNAPGSEQRLPFKHALDTHWASQNALDTLFETLTDIKAFAEPLLKNALRDYGAIDVLNTSIRLYAPATLPWWTFGTHPGVSVRTTTLLDAALHNFSASETFVDYAFLAAEDARGQREILTFKHRVTGQPLTADHFKTVCRNLDIGARYVQNLTLTVGFGNASVATSFRQKVIHNLKAALNSAAHVALAKKDITEDSYTLIQSLLQRDGPLQLGGQTMDVYALSLLDTRLLGIFIIAPARLDAALHKILVYIPDDPAHPIKDYSSAPAFVKELTGQLRDRTPSDDPSRRSYQQFFSQFVAHQERGRFFYQLNQLLSTVRWHDREPGDSRPNWRPEPVETPNLQFRTLAVRDDIQNRGDDPGQDNLWHYLYRVKLNKCVNDAREIAISTAYADRMARWEWWDNLEKMLSDIFNAALLVITPFVPLLGELMLAYTTYQMLDDVFEGIVDWAEGLQREAAEHLLSIAENALQLALFDAGARVGEIAKVKLSTFVEQLQPVQTPSAQTRLWAPDLAPYQHTNLRLPETSIAHENGLHHHQGKQIAKVENHHYEVRKDPVTQTYTLAHPKRTSAYQPPVALNGSGACVLAGEQPRTWNNARLLRRLGPQTNGLTAGELEQVRQISGVEFGDLRHMYVNNEPTPPLLADTLKRFNSEKGIREAGDAIRTGQPLDPSSDWFEQMVTELEGWPRDKALLVYPRGDSSGTPRRYGNAQATGADTLSLNIADVMSGRLAEKVVDYLDEPQLTQLLGKQLPENERVQALRERLAAYVEQQSASLAHSDYSRQEASDEPSIQLLRSQYPDLPLSIAQSLVRHTRRRHLSIMSEKKRLPLEVKNQARELDFEVRSTRMLEQLVQGTPPSTHTENLALNTLRIHSDSFANLRIQVRERTPTGDLRTQVGAEDAAHLKILVRNRKGQYRVFDAGGKLIHGPTDFYNAVFQALPPESSLRDSDTLRTWLIEKNKAPTERRLALAEAPIPTHPERKTLTLLGGGNSMSRVVDVEVNPVTVQGNIKHWLPGMSEQGVKRFAEKAESDEGRLQLEHLKAEGKALDKALHTYLKDSTRFPYRNSLEEVLARKAFTRKLKEAWREGYTKLHDEFNTAGNDVYLDLSDTVLPTELPVLPFELGLVTHLHMNGSGFAAEHTPFLAHFPKLKTLDLADNRLVTLPEAIGNMRSLKALDVSNNAIALDNTAVQQLKKLRRLQGLDLSKNPLGRVPDISHMRDLTALDLSHTGISEWPAGLFAHERDASFDLYLRGNPITTIPEVARESAEAFTVANTWLDRATLTPEARALWDEHKTDFGLDPYRTYPPKGDADFWVDDLDDDNQIRFANVWFDLENEEGSQGFFEVIKKLEQPEAFEDPMDEMRYEQNRRILTDQVRHMLLSMHEDTMLRQELFKMSSFPGLCPDASRQIFTEMGIQVTATTARRYSRTQAEHEETITRLAQGAASLKMVNDVARADIANRLKPANQGGQGLRLSTQVVDGQPGSVDEVEVYLAYQTRLSKSLNLPWVSDSMTYRNTANVPESSIIHAGKAVKDLSEGDGLVNRMLQEPYWEPFLKERYAKDYAANEENTVQQLESLEQLDTEQKAFAQAQDLNEQEKTQKREALKSRIEQLQIEDRVVPDQVMSEDLYNQLYNDLSERRMEWLREQTHLSLERLER